MHIPSRLSQRSGIKPQDTICEAVTRCRVRCTFDLVGRLTEQQMINNAWIPRNSAKKTLIYVLHDCYDPIVVACCSTCSPQRPTSTPSWWYAVANRFLSSPHGCHVFAFVKAICICAQCANLCDSTQSKSYHVGNAAVTPNVVHGHPVVNRLRFSGWELPALRAPERWTIPCTRPLSPRQHPNKHMYVFGWPSFTTRLGYNRYSSNNWSLFFKRALPIHLKP